MGCLIQITYTESASEDPSPFFILKYLQFFTNSIIMEESLCGKKYVYKMYVCWPENKVSKFIIETLSHERRIYKAIIIS
jgi:hypothetical protein